jgi:sigma-E factor negative regulatory protein RseA
MDKISALMDGELDARQAEQQVGRLRHDTEARACWDTFHLIGDALRGECRFSAQFGARLYARLEQEPTVLAPRRRTPAGRATAYALSAAASVAAVALVGWVALQNAPVPPAQIAAAPAPVPVSVPVTPPPVEPVSVPSEGTMNQYIFAHQGFSPSTAIQGLAPYIRSVSAEQTTKVRE